MITVNDIHFWEKMEPSVELPFDREAARSCTLDFNTDREVAVYIWLANKPAPQFLALVKGRETVKFVVPCAYAVVHNDPEAEVWILTRDGKTLHRIADEQEEVYTKLHTHVETDPHLKAVEEKMTRRLNRRYEAITNEMGRLKELEARLEAKINGSGTESEAGGQQSGNAQAPDPAGGGQVADEGKTVGDASKPDGTPPNVSADGA